MRKVMTLAALGILLQGTLACGGKGGPRDSGAGDDTGLVDSDGDGWTIADGDCDDGDPSVNPGALEVCGGPDENCNDMTDEANAEGCTTFYEDIDDDGYGGSPYQCLCEATGDYTTDTTGDCDDQDPSVNPEGEEVCGGEDEDCDGGTDERDALGCEPWYEDGDGDGYGSDVWECRCGPSYSCPTQVTGDCDDTVATTYPGAPEICGDVVDSDCDGLGLECLIDLSEADGKLVGEGRQDYAGSAVAAGDVDGDGIDEVLVGAPQEDAGGTEAGATYLVQGPTSGEVSLSLASVKLKGEAADDGSGVSLAVGDIDGDGVEDVLVGAWGRDAGGADAGAAYLVSGPVASSSGLSVADAEFVGEEAGDRAARWLAAGDVDGDGFEDVLVGAYGQDEGGEDGGVAYVVLGPAAGTIDLSAADGRFVGEEAGDQAGWTLTAGDVDGDGVEDVLVGACENDAGGDGAGAAYLLTGPAAGTIDLSEADAKLVGEEPEDAAGYSLAAGDVDGDGVEDLLVGAPGQDAGGSYAGAAYLVLGPAAGTVDLSLAEAKIVGEEGGDAAGWSLEVADVDGDGIGDLVVGAYYEGTGGSNAGAVYLEHGPVTGTVDLYLADVKFTGEEENNWAGGALTLGDTDGGGLPDIVVGAFGQDAGGLYAGAAYVVLGEGI